MDYTEIINKFNLTAEQFEKLTKQHKDILWFICKRGSISPMEAYPDLYITKLSTRISEMKAIGIQFDQKYECHENSLGRKTHYMRYRKAV